MLLDKGADANVQDVVSVLLKTNYLIIVAGVAMGGQ